MSDLKGWKAVVILFLICVAFFVTVVLLLAKCPDRDQRDDCYDIAIGHGISCVNEAHRVSGLCECRDRHNHVVVFDVVNEPDIGP